MRWLATAMNMNPHVSLKKMELLEMVRDPFIERICQDSPPVGAASGSGAELPASSSPAAPVTVPAPGPSLTETVRALQQDITALYGLAEARLHERTKEHEQIVKVLKMHDERLGELETTMDKEQAKTSKALKFHHGRLEVLETLLPDEEESDEPEHQEEEEAEEEPPAEEQEEEEAATEEEVEQEAEKQPKPRPVVMTGQEWRQAIRGAVSRDMMTCQVRRQTVGGEVSRDMMTGRDWQQAMEVPWTAPMHNSCETWRL